MPGQYDHAVDMIWHYHMIIQNNTGKRIWDIHPVLFNDPANLG